MGKKTAVPAVKPKAKPKTQASKAKSNPTSSTKKRKDPPRSPNPFEQPPDQGQASILTYAASASHSRPETPLSLQSEVVDTEDQKTSGTTANASQNHDIQLADVTALAYNIWNSGSDNFVSDLHDLCMRYDEDQISSLIGQCREHELFDAHCKSVIESAGLTDDEWVFGCGETGDPLEDLVEMLRWLTLRHASTTMDVAVAPSTSKDISYRCR